MSAKIVVDLAYVEWGSAHRQRSLREALNCVALAKAQVGHLVVADNKLECAPLGNIPARRTTVVPGNNLAREFSGWDAAYAALDQTDQGSGANVLLFVNDTFGTHRRIRLSRRMRVASWLRTVAQSPRPEMFGSTDLFGKAPGHWRFGTLSRYVSSYLFGMNLPAARLLFPLCQIDAQLDLLLAREFSAAGLFTKELPCEFRDRINGWLVTSGNWRNAAPLTAANFDFFRLKAKSVLYEYALTSRADSAGIVVSDLFTGRDAMDRLAGRLAREWITHTTAAHYPWFRVIKDALRSYRGPA